MRLTLTVEATADSEEEIGEALEAIRQQIAEMGLSGGEVAARSYTYTYQIKGYS